MCKCKDASEHVQGGKKCPVVLLNDGFTIDLGMEIAKSIKMHLQLGPYVIINNLRRAKLDPNREIAIGAQDSAAIEAFEAYHDGIDQLKTKLKRALLIDLHGRVSNDSINQVGYCLNRSHLITNSHSSQLDPHVGSSITTLAKENPSLNLITGSLSFGAFIEQEGLKAVPAPKIPNPGNVIAIFENVCANIEISRKFAQNTNICQRFSHIQGAKSIALCTGKRWQAKLIPNH